MTHSATETLQLHSPSLKYWGRERGSYEGEQLEGETGPCNIEGFCCMSVPSKRKICMDQPLHWFSGVVTVLESLNSQQFP